MDVSLIHGGASDAAMIDSGDVVPLSERFQSKYAEAFVQAGADQATIKAMANDPTTAGDPALLWQLQQLQEHYTKQMTLMAVLVNHGVKGVETLVKT